MERFWTLKYLQQNGITELTATTFKEGPQGILVRADDLPLVLPVLGAQGLARGARVRVRLGAIDEITLDVSGTVIEQLDAVPAASADEGVEEDEDEAAAGPIAIAVDMDEAEAPAIPTSTASADNPTP